MVVRRAQRPSPRPRTEDPAIRTQQRAEAKALKKAEKLAERLVARELKKDPQLTPEKLIERLARLVDDVATQPTGQALKPADGNREPFAGLPTFSPSQLAGGLGRPVGQNDQATAQTPVGPPEDLSKATIFGRPVETNSSHDLFHHYFGGRPAPANNDEARAMMKEMAEKFAPFGFKVEPIEHERMDKVMITGPDGKKEEVDFIYAAGGKPGEQKLQWLATNPVGPGAKGGGLDSGAVLNVLSAYPATNAGITKALEELRKKPGYEETELLQHPQRLDKLKFPNGQVVDVIIGAGGPNPSWGWLPE